MASRGKGKAQPTRKRNRKQKRLSRATSARRSTRSTRSLEPSRKTARSRPKGDRHPRPEESKVRRAIQDLGKAFRHLELSGHALLKTISDLQDSAVETHRSKLIRALVADQVLQDLSDARAAAEGIPEERVPESLRPFSILPQALADWFERNLGVRPFARRGQEMEIPSERLSDYSVSGEIPGTMPALIRIRVTSQGWQSATETLIKPSVELLD